MAKVEIHPIVPKEHLQAIRRQIKETGLDKINSNECYILKKVSSESPGEIPEGEVIMHSAMCQIVGNLTAVALYSYDYKGTWHRTSPIVKCEDKDRYFQIETQNSIYILIK